MSRKNTFVEKFSEFADKISGPLVKFGNFPIVAGIQEGLVGVMAPIMIGSFALILGIFSSDTTLPGGVAYLPFLSAYTGHFYTLFGMTLGFLGFFASLTIAQAYAKRVNVDVQTAGVLGVGTFLILTLNSIIDQWTAGKISVNSFGLKGLFIAMISSIVSVAIYKYLVNKKITIRLPDSVPPAVSQAFTSIIPFTVIFGLAWWSSVVMQFDITEWFAGLLAPIISGADNIFTFTFMSTLNNFLWSVGLHGGNMLSPITFPLEVSGLSANAEFVALGGALKDLPRIWAGSFQYLQVWTAPIWSLLILMVFSKVKYLRTMAIVCIPAAIFSIVEPVIFGLPLALNPFLIIPFILSTFVSAIFTYGVFALGLVTRFFAALPWATPPFLLGPLATGGDLRTLLVIIGNILIGMAIYLPFFRSYEKHEIAKELAKKKELEATVK
jgi:PTS system cellobiose-specific IIC component